jgi:hypothetical protein
MDPTYPRQKLSEEVTLLSETGEELVKTYEKARLAEIERLYFVL